MTAAIILSVINGALAIVTGAAAIRALRLFNQHGQHIIDLHDEADAILADARSIVHDAAEQHAAGVELLDDIYAFAQAIGTKYADVKA